MDYTRCPHFQVSALMSFTVLLIMYAHTHVRTLLSVVYRNTGDHRVVDSVG